MVSRLLASATTLLTLLANPLNITLLTSQLLSGPAIWQHAKGLQIPLQLLSTFNTAGRHILDAKRKLDSVQQDQLHASPIDIVEWSRAVANGADEKVPYWKHVLVLGGLLSGLTEMEYPGLAKDLRRNLEIAVANATNRALLDLNDHENMAAGAICLTLGHALKSLGSDTRGLLRFDLLLPVLTQQLLRSSNGLRWGYFLGVIDRDICQTGAQQFSWPTSSTSFYQLQELSRSPLIGCLGSLSQLLALCLECTPDMGTFFDALEGLLTFSRSLTVQWRQNKASEIDWTEEGEFLDQQTLTATMPVLWQLLRSVVFTSVVMLQATISRTLHDRQVPLSRHTLLASRTLSTLRNLYFISSRLGHQAFSQYTFVYMAAVDMLSKQPSVVHAFLKEIKPSLSGSIPVHPHDRCLDLFFFNLAEHFTLALSAASSETLLLDTAMPYLEGGIDSRLMENFEAAHSLVLSAFSVPHNVDLVARRLPAYVDILFASFPGNLSPRQFGLAIKTLVRIVSPPHPMSENQPLLASAILDITYTRLQTASEVPSAKQPRIPSTEDSEISERTAMLLTIIDSLPALPPSVLEEWLAMAGDALQFVESRSAQELCRRRIWDVLSNGEMDVPRAEVCLVWWNDRGGRRLVLDGADGLPDAPVMSGALPESSKL